MYVERAVNSDLAALARGGAGDKAAKAPTDKPRILSVDTDTAGFVRKAISLPYDVPASVIEQAKALVASGQLDSASAIRQVATTIANIGI
jgi:hypothetical protein